VVDSGGRPHVAYQDRGRGALKYGRQDATGWLNYELDGAGVGDTGLYSSLALDGNEQPVIVYLSARIDQDRQRVSVLRLAQATSPSPTTIADWRFRDLVVTDLSAYPCEERCNLDEVCLASNQACVVPSPASACNPTCANREACINGTCQGTRSLQAFRDLPLARGLWPEVKVLPNGDALIAYYDRVDRNLRMTRIAGPDLIGGALTATILEGTGAPVPTGEDTGLYPSLFVTPGGEVHLSYQNASRQALLYRNIDPTNLQTLAIEDVEVGLGMGMGPDGLLLGADSALVVDNQGAVRIAYQDATNGDLRYAGATASTPGSASPWPEPRCLMPAASASTRTSASPRIARRSSSPPTGISSPARAAPKRRRPVLTALIEAGAHRIQQHLPRWKCTPDPRGNRCPMGRTTTHQ
jgi:hypothetical protein